MKRKYRKNANKPRRMTRAWFAWLVKYLYG
jgi:hypothetical protein